MLGTPEENQLITLSELLTFHIPEAERQKCRLNFRALEFCVNVVFHEVINTNFTWAECHLFLFACLEDSII